MNVSEKEPTMKIEKANESLSNIFEGFIRYEQTLINSLSGENWDIADSMALTECDCLIILDVDTNAFAVSADKPEGLNPLHAPLEFGLQDTFDAFELQWGRRISAAERTAERCPV